MVNDFEKIQIFMTSGEQLLLIPDIPLLYMADVTEAGDKRKMMSPML